MARSQLFIALLVLLAATVAFAQPVTVTVDRSEVAVNEIFSVTVVAEGQDVGQPELPVTDDLQFDTKNVPQQYRMSMSGGKMSATREWQFRARATRAGEITLPPIKIEIDGSNYASDPISLKVVQSKGELPVPTPTRSSRSSAGERQELTFNDVVRIESTVDKRRVFQGEPLLLTLRLYQLDNMGVHIMYRGGQSLPMPDIQGFYLGPLKPRTYTDQVNELPYEVQEFQQTLYPTGSGDFVIGAWSWQGDVMARGSRPVYGELETDPIEVSVLPLPPRPAGFTGAVGRFELRASVLNSEIVQGAPTQLQVRIIGDGNPDAIGAPPLPEIPWAHVSEPSSELRELDGTDWRRIEKVFSYSITARDAGSQTIPAISFVYFSPELAKYQTEESDPFTVEVKPSGESNDLVVIGGDEGQTGLKILADDIVSILPTADLEPAPSQALVNVVSFAGPPILFAGLLLFVRRKQRLEGNTGYARAHRARTEAQKRLRAADSATDPTEGLHRALTEYIANKINVNASGMTSDDARQLLEREGVRGEQIETVSKILRTCERKRYAGAALSPEELHALRQGAERAIESLEAQLGNGKP